MRWRPELGSGVANLVATQLPPPVLQALTRLLANIRWIVVPFVAMLGLLAPPHQPILLVLLTLAILAYNGWAAVVLSDRPPLAARAIGRLVAVFDVITLMSLVLIYGGGPGPGGALYGLFAGPLLELAAYWGVLGMLTGVASFAIFQLVLRAGLAVVGRQAWTLDPVILVWTLTMLVLGVGLSGLIWVVATALNAQIDARPEPAILPGKGASVIRLSGREEEVLRLVAEGYSNTMIASRLHLSESTVKGHVESLLTRLNARNRAEAVAAASRLRLL